LLKKPWFPKDFSKKAIFCSFYLDLQREKSIIIVGAMVAPKVLKGEGYAIPFSRVSTGLIAVSFGIRYAGNTRKR